MEFIPKLNPFTGDLQLVTDTSGIVSIVYKPSVPSYANLPLTGNTTNDARMTDDTQHLYVWSGTAWADQGDILNINWGSIGGSIINQTDLYLALGGKLATVSSTVKSALAGNGSQSITFDYTTDFDLTDIPEFTMECWVYFTSLNTYNYIYKQPSSTYPTTVGLRHDGNNRLEFTFRGSVFYSSPLSPTLNTWYHIAFDREPTYSHWYIHGNQDTGYANAHDPLPQDNNITLFSNLNGYISNFRFSNTRRYTNYTYPLPTADFVPDANTVMLIKGTSPIVDEMGRPFTGVSMTVDGTKSPYTQSGIVLVDPSGVPTANNYSKSQIDTLLLKQHTKNSDSILAENTPDEVSASELRDTVDVISTLATKTNVLEKDNTTSFTPDADYEPSTKKYVDDIKAGAMGVVIHGATAGTARPSGFASITWIGSVEPTNATNNDVWINTA